MSILDIQPVNREVAKVITGLASGTGGGKTRTALELAYGLSGGNPRKIGFLDTESGRGALYDSVFSEPYMIAQLRPPYSPRRYTDAITEFSQTGVEVLIVDSMSHEWTGEGGCQDIAAAAIAKGKKMADWITAKREHNYFMRSLLSIPCHLVLCFRAKEKTDFSNPSQPVGVGLHAQCEKDVMFECTTSFMLEEGGYRSPLKKIPEFFPFLEGDGYLTREHGKKMREWFGGSDPMEIARKGLQFAANQGTERLKSAWSILSKPIQKELLSFKETLKDVAAHADSDKLIIDTSMELTEEEKSKLARQEKEGKL